MDTNQIILIGRLTSDSELKQSKAGATFAKFSLAVNGFKNDEVCFVSCTVWNEKKAAVAGQYLQKGKRIAVTGSLGQQRWEDSEGKKRSAHYVNVFNFQFLDSKAEQSPAAAQGGQPATPQQMGQELNQQMGAQPAETPINMNMGAKVDDSDLPF